MSYEGDRYMWLVVMFDLPVLTKVQRGRAARFRRFLLKDGYLMLQLSVYARICNGSEMTGKHLKRLQDGIPPEGSVKALQITDKQYGQMKFLVNTGRKNAHPGHLGPTDQLLLF